MQLFRAFINVNEQQIVQKQILHERILVVVFLERADQPLHLKRRHAPDHERIVRFPADNDDILELLVIKNLEKLIRSCRLRIRRGCSLPSASIIPSSTREISLIPSIVDCKT